MLRHLTEGLVTKSGSHVSRVLALLQEIRAGFEQAIQAVGHEPA